MSNSIQNDLNRKYSKATVTIHWLTPILILVLFPLGKYMEEFVPAEKMGLVQIHAIFGIIVFAMTLFRSYLFFKAPRPDHIKTGSTFNDKLAVWVHNAFYFLLLGVTVSGIAVLIIGGYGDALSGGDPGLIKSHGEIPPLKAHGLLATVIMLLFAMHVVGVIKHYVSTKENILRRIFY